MCGCDRKDYASNFSGGFFRLVRAELVFKKQERVFIGVCHVINTIIRLDGFSVIFVRFNIQLYWLCRLFSPSGCFLLCVSLSFHASVIFRYEFITWNSKGAAASFDDEKIKGLSRRCLFAFFA